MVMTGPPIATRPAVVHAATLTDPDLWHNPHFIRDVQHLPHSATPVRFRRRTLTLFAWYVLHARHGLAQAPAWRVTLILTMTRLAAIGLLGMAVMRAAVAGVSPDYILLADAAPGSLNTSALLLGFGSVIGSWIGLVLLLGAFIYSYASLQDGLLRALVGSPANYLIDVWRYPVWVIWVQATYVLPPLVLVAAIYGYYQFLAARARRSILRRAFEG